MNCPCQISVNQQSDLRVDTLKQHYRPSFSPALNTAGDFSPLTQPLQAQTLRHGNRIAVKHVAKLGIQSRVDCF